MLSINFVVLLLVAACSAQVIDNCFDENKLLCSLKKADCDTVTQIKQSCPATCGTCKDNGALSTQYKLTYFDFKGRAEQIRWILVQGEANWKDIRLSNNDWLAIKPTTLTGQIPFLEVDGTTIAQSGAIALYLARELGLAGSSNLETAEVQMIWDTVQETMNQGARINLERDQVEKAKLQTEYDNVDLPRLVKFLEKRLEGGDKWIVGNKFTAADIVAASFLDSQIGEGANIVKKYPNLVAITNAVKSLPKIKEWIKNRPPSPY